MTTVFTQRVQAVRDYLGADPSWDDGNGVDVVVATAYHRLNDALAEQEAEELARTRRSAAAAIAAIRTATASADRVR